MYNTRYQLFADSIIQITLLNSPQAFRNVQWLKFTSASMFFPPPIMSFMPSFTTVTTVFVVA